MARGQMKDVASLLLFLNFCMYVVVVCIGGWATNIAIDRGFIIGNPLCKFVLSYAISTSSSYRWLFLFFPGKILNASYAEAIPFM